MGNSTWGIHISSCRYELHPILPCSTQILDFKCSYINYNFFFWNQQSFSVTGSENSGSTGKNKGVFIEYPPPKPDQMFAGQEEEDTTVSSLTKSRVLPCPSKHTNQLNSLTLSSSIYILPLLQQLECQQTLITSLTPFPTKDSLTEARPFDSQGYLQTFLGVIEISYSLFTMVQNI